MVALCVEQKKKKNSVKIWNKKRAPLFWREHSAACSLLHRRYFLKPKPSRNQSVTDVVKRESESEHGSRPNARRVFNRRKGQM